MFTIPFKYDLVLSRYSLIDKIFFFYYYFHIQYNCCYKNIYFYWFVIIFFFLKKGHNISNYFVFDGFVFFF